MNGEQAVRLCQLVGMICPAQKMERDTPKAWAALLDDTHLDTALEAVKVLGRTQNFISPAEIRAEVKRIRARRVDAVTLVPPAGLEQAEERAWLKAAYAQVADGGPAPSNGRALGSRTLGELLAGPVAPDPDKA